MMTRFLLTLCLLTAAPLWAATTLLDFETEGEAGLFHDQGRASAKNFPVTQEARWATSGGYSVCFRTPKWQPGKPEWPATELQPPIVDWSNYDRLVLDLTNPTAFDQKLILVISDSTLPVRRSLHTYANLVPSSYLQVVVDLTKVADRGVDLHDIHVLHFFTERPVGDMEVYLDRVTLLQPDEPLPVPQASFIKSVAGLQAGQIMALKQFEAEAHERIVASAAGVPAVKTWADKLLADNDQRVATFAAQVEQQDPAVLQSAKIVASLREDTTRVESLVRFRTSFNALREAVQTSPDSRGDLVVGFASSMEKVLPRAGVPAVRADKGTTLALARNEKEALQVVVMPTEAEAKQVSVRVSDLHAPDGTVFPAANIDTPPMGYVETKNTPAYGSAHVGWWPDPILSFMSAVDIAPGDAQAFWVRVRAPKQQAAGTYAGKLEVLVEGQPMYAFDLSVEVYPFTLPDRSPLNMAITFSPRYFEPNDKGGWQKGPYRDLSWEQHKVQWADLLADYYLTYNSLYSDAEPEWPILTRLQEQGRLGLFNLGYFGLMPNQPEDQEKWRTNTRARLGKAYEQAKTLGLLDHAYLYGCDEAPIAAFPAVERAAAFLKAEYPGVMILTTALDRSVGTNSVLQSVDGFCPLTPYYKRDLADRVRATGKQVWWYICKSPDHPFANMFVEFPAIEGRVLMGAQTAKYRPDGFLYYQVSTWNSPPITKGPFTDWNPHSWTTYNGDGSWTCAGPDGTPLPTIRLENFRDGVEDYGYAMLLQEAIKKAEAAPNPTAKQQEWLKQAKAALEVPDSVSTSMTEYTQNPADVYAWRRGMAEALAAAE